MNETAGCSPKLRFSGDNNTNDVKYVSGLSTILVATIQEAKDRISQIEYIFCSQLYPNFQSKSKSLQKIYLDSKRDAEDAWKEKEKDLLCEIEKLRAEKRELEDQNQGLMVESNKALGEQSEKVEKLLGKMISQQNRIDELGEEVMRKSKEVDEGMELQNTLIQLVKAKASMIVDKDKQLNEREEKANELLAKVKGLQKKVEEFQEEIKRKDEKIAKEDDLSEKIEILSLKLVGGEKLLVECEEDKRKLSCKLDHMKEKAGELEMKLKKKMEETEEGKALQAQLLQQIDGNAVEILKLKEQLEDSENEKKRLMDKLNDLEKKVNLLQENQMGISKVAEREVTYEKLLREIESKDSELLTEKKKRMDVSEAYKRLKSQYNFLCGKSGLTTKNMVPWNKVEDESGSLKCHHNSPTLQDTSDPADEMEELQTENELCDDGGIVGEVKKVKTENEFSCGLEDIREARSIRVSSFQSPTSSYIRPKCPSAVKSAPVTGSKRPASCWIDTRSHQRKDGPDPHDDFLDTPFENLRGNLKKAMVEDANNIHVPVLKEDPDDSGDETQNVNIGPCPREQQMPVPVPGKVGFKFVEPVRKKAERENLKGVECKQCKKFYDAVLPNSGSKHGDGNKQNFRCEHQDGVSRHRYKYMPPLTPEGFWNIGFESEM